MSEGGWLSEELADIGDKMIEGMIAGLESTDKTLGEAERRMHKAIAKGYEAQERKENMKIEDCKTLTEFFGVRYGGYIWIKDERYVVLNQLISSVCNTSTARDCQALVGCLTGQLEWSTTEPMTAEEEKIIREIAAWFPQSDRDPGQSCSKRLFMTHGDIYLGGDVSTFMPFGDETYNSKAYEVLAPILEKYGEINLDEYRENNSEGY